MVIIYVFFRYLRFFFRILIQFLVYDRVSKRLYFYYISRKGNDNMMGNQLL